MATRSTPAKASTRATAPKAETKAEETSAIETPEVKEAPKAKAPAAQQVEIVHGGFVVAGRVLAEGTRLEVTEALSETEEEQIAAYGKVFYKTV